MLTAILNKVISPSFIDGPGSRMVIFFSVVMHCLYCHNPETQQYCTGCGTCLEVCQSDALKLVNGQIEYNPKQCSGCDRCILSCPHDASPKVAHMTVDQLMAKVAAQEPYIDGITLSGGECSLQYEFILKFLTKVKAKTGLNVLIDTNGYIPEDVLKKLSKLADGFILDFKSNNLLEAY